MVIKKFNRLELAITCKYHYYYWGEAPLFGQPPGVNPAVLFDITYWEEPSSTEFTEQKEGGLGGATDTTQTGLDCVKVTQTIRLVSLQFVKIII